MTDSKVKFMEALKAIFNAYDGNSDAHTCTAWHLAGAVVDGPLDIECAKELMQKIGKEITRSNDYHYNCGYTNGYDDAEGNIGVCGEDW